MLVAPSHAAAHKVQEGYEGRVEEEVVAGLVAKQSKWSNGKQSLSARFNQNCRLDRYTYHSSKPRARLFQPVGSDWAHSREKNQTCTRRKAPRETNALPKRVTLF